MPFSVGLQRMARRSNCGVNAYGGERVLQRFTRTHVHVHVTGGHQRQAARGRAFAQRIE